jgi:hypothetical protein
MVIAVHPGFLRCRVSEFNFLFETLVNVRTTEPKVAEFSREAAAACSRGRKPTVVIESEFRSREAAAADPFAAAASRLGEFLV